MKQIVIAILGVTLSSHCLAGWPFDTKGSASEQKEEILRGLASKMNKTLPMMLDATTRHDSTMAGPGEKLTYLLTIIDLDVKYENSSAHQDAVKYIHNEIYPTTIRGMCSTPSTRKGIDLGITNAYQYRDAKGIYITTTSVDKNLCKRYGL